MNCAEAKSKMAALVLGDLEGPALERLAEHLKACAACREERVQQEKALAALRSVPAPEPSAARRDRVVAAMTALPASPLLDRPRRRWVAPASVAAALLLTISGAWAGMTGRLDWIVNRPAYRLTAEDIKGEALVMRAGGATWEPLARGGEIRLGDRVMTNGGRVAFRSTARDLILLADATQVMINRDDPRAPGVMLVYGELWAEISPRTEGHLRFESPEGEGFVEVLGTRLHVEYR